MGYGLTDGGFFWTGISDLTDVKILSSGSDHEEKSALEEAKEYLQETLAAGPIPSAEILKQSKKDGIAERTLNRAKKDIGIISARENDVWYWKMPEKKEAPRNAKWEMEI